MTDLHAHETALFTAMSVACEELRKILDASPGNPDPRLGYIRAVMDDTQRELDAFLEDRDIAHVSKVVEITSIASAQLKEWGMV